MKNNLAPSYKAIAIAILKNDHSLKTLGFDKAESDISSQLIANKKYSNDMFS
jgi:predicted phosphoadenosine phosphosulfate sulfurtransferase